MIGLDTNVVLRFLLNDDPDQSPVAQQLFSSVLSPMNPGFISIVALLETVWTLRTSYKLPPLAIADAVEGLSGLPNVVVQAEAEVHAALRQVRDYGHSFADALLGELNRLAGCSKTLSFDRRALRLPGFEHP